MSQLPPSNRDRERFDELLVDRATIGLTAAEQTELDQLAQQLNVPVDDSVDLAAAAVDSLVAAEELVPLPEHLRDAVLKSATSESATSESVVQTRNSIDDPKVELAARTAPVVNTNGTNGLRTRDFLGMLVVAASLMLAAFAWFGDKTKPAPSIAELHDQFVSVQPADLVDVSWTSTDPNATIEGSVLFSSELQEGYMTFKGLPINDPKVEQYQLWIFDRVRDEKYPVDGGVFDIAAANKRTIVKINPKINVTEATLFAITIEKPGGVVVSDRSRLPLLAKVAAK